MEKNNGCVMSAWQSEVDDGGREAKRNWKKENAVERRERDVASK